jgi:hypothetical protein
MAMADVNRDLKAEENEEATDLPVLHTWPAVYAFVLGSFIFWIVLLTALSRAFS